MTDKLPGDDTRCKVTILDEDFPGCLGFENTDLFVFKVGQSNLVHADEICAWLVYFELFDYG